MHVSEVILQRFHGWAGPVRFTPAELAVLIGPNSSGKTSLFQAIDVVLNPFRDAYRNRLDEHDYFGLDTSEPVRIEVIVAGLNPDDLNYFEPYVEGRRADGSFGGWDSPQDEFDRSDLVLRIEFRGIFGEPSRAFYARAEAREAPVRQADKVRIGWHYVRADMDPLHELAFFSNSVFSKLFDGADLSSQLDAIRQGIEDTKGPLMAEEHVAETRMRLEQAARRLRLVDGPDALDFAVAGLSDRRVLQSLQLVLRGRRSDKHLPLASHGRGLLRVLLLTAILQQARLAESNLILAVEEPEQNLEPINQRLVMRSLLSTDAGAQQLMVATHSPDIAGSVPLQALHLAREFSETPDLRSLRAIAATEHKFFERHARGAVVDGLYADAVLLVEGATERGGLPVFWAAHRPGDGLDEHRIEIVACEGIKPMPSFVRFFKALGIPVIVLCDNDKSDDCAKIINAGPDLLIRWATHLDWEGVLGAESPVRPVATALEECMDTIGGWEEHEHSLRECVRRSAGEADHLAGAESVWALLDGYGEPDQRAALTALLRGQSGVDFKSTIHARQISQAITVPPTMAAMIDLVHRCVVGDVQARGVHGL
jgi:hypothetical protein